MRTVDIIEKKRDGGKLNEKEIRFFVNGFTSGEIPEYQASALAMAILFRGMDKEEIGILTDAMEHSGATIDLSDTPGIKVDKHSTGGVGDKTSLVVGPLVAACGAKVAKMSGRGLGHTGGTLDKLESVPGTRINLSEEEFKKEIREIGLTIVGQSSELDPADKKLYALRDVTGTVPSIPLIASSIMSKKLASGSDAILLDVKFGKGAFMKSIEQATELAKTMVDIGDELHRDTRAVITDMDQPLGMAVGNSIEVKEAIATLKGKGPKDLTELAISSGGIMLEQAKIVKTAKEGETRIKEAIANGSGLKKLAEMFAYQGGDASYIYHPEKFEVSKNIIEIKAESEGYVEVIDSLAIGIGAMRLGAGREKLGDVIDMSAGILLNKKIGDYVKKGELLCSCFTNKNDVNETIEDIKKAFRIVKNKVEVPPTVHSIIS